MRIALCSHWSFHAWFEFKCAAKPTSIAGASCKFGSPDESAFFSATKVGGDNQGEGHVGRESEGVGERSAE